MPIEKTFNLNYVAIRLIKRIDNWAIVELGRLSEQDTELLEEAFKNRKPDLTDEMADPLQGEIEIEAPITEACPPYKTARACFYLSETAKHKLRDPNEIRDACRVSIWYTAACTRPTISDISGEPIHDGDKPACWFYEHPTQWDEDYHSRRGDVKLEADCARPFNAVALNIVKCLGGDRYTVKIGRLSKAEKARLGYLYTKLPQNHGYLFGDDTRGMVTVTKREVSDATFYEAHLCVRIYNGADVFHEGVIFDTCDFKLAARREEFEPRLVLKNFRNKQSDGIIAKDWFKEEEPEDAEGDATMPEEAFTLMGVAIKTREVIRTYNGMYVCKIRIGRMSESERHKLESFVTGISACHGPYRSPISMVEDGKTIPGTREPLHTYELHVYMTTIPSPVVDVCDLKFTYVAEKGMLLAEVVDVYAPSGIRGVNWFNAQMEEPEDSEGYVDTDILLTENLDTVRIRPIWTDAGLHETVPEIEKIEFHEPATIIFWKDGTKSVVKARDGEPYDAEKGIAMAIAKKALGNERDYYNTFIHWMKRYKKKGGKR